MIRARLLENSDHRLYGFIIDGHAGYDEPGQDIICATVSVLATNTANSIEALIRLPMETEVSEGHMKVMIPSIREGKNCGEAELLLQSLQLGLQSVVDAYGTDFVKLSVRSE